MMHITYLIVGFFGIMVLLVIWRFLNWIHDNDAWLWLLGFVSFWVIMYLLGFGVVEGIKMLG